MDPSRYMIVDLKHSHDKRMFVTERVTSIQKDGNGYWTVFFVTGQHPFRYNPSRLLCLTDPESIDIAEKGLYVRDVHVGDAAALLRFSDRMHSFYHIVRNNGRYEDLEAKDVYISRTSIDRHGGSTWQYLKKLAAETSLLTPDEESILSLQYEKVDTYRDKVPLAQYLGDPTPLRIFHHPDQVYFPFGCNASQKSAVEQALTHQVSMIQGPPGTGKTQTILNIIANLLMVEKTVLVVSNNNSAVDNVAEKLAAKDLGFIVAKLGSVENREAFVENQPECPSMLGWRVESVETTRQLAADSLETVSRGFDSQKRYAQLKVEYDTLLRETEYNDRLGRDLAGMEWLNGKNAAEIIKLLHLLERAMEHGKTLGFWFRLKWALRLGLKMFSLFKNELPNVVEILKTAYYRARKTQIERELKSVERTLQSQNMQKALQTLHRSSLSLLKDKIARRYDGKERKKFTVGNIKSRTGAFLQEYPVVLSTTYSAKNCITPDMVFDYVIMDEASQVDIATGALALSCATNAVIVGDDKQLPNVVGREEEMALNAIQAAYNVDEKYNAATHSFLQSCAEVFRDAPSTLLREHYRCHPKIIEFCNQRFYGGELVAMTADRGEQKVLLAVRTVEGNHARSHFNRREMEVLMQEVLPEYAQTGTLGIITPYRLQAQEINRALGQEIASTIHKYQGRECDTIIISTVDNEPTEFSDDPNLLNVAVSRAKRHLCIVTNGNEMPPDSNLAQLIAYIQYNNFEVRDSRLHSVFDLLYRQYTAERLAYAATHHSVSENLSENLVYDVIVKAMSTLDRSNMDVVCHYPLSRLVADWSLLDSQEKAFAGSPFAHVDFLIYNALTKQPRLAIEVDGWHFHQSEVQQARDTLKNRILNKLGLCLKRISTTDTVTVETMMRLLEG